MQSPARQEGALSPSSSQSRSNSIGSDASPSTKRPSVLTSFPTLRPPPAYVALAAASQLATDHRNLRTPDGGHERANGVEHDDEGALFSERALLMINTFLDQILYNLLNASRSTSLIHLRSAVELVLKGKLARMAIVTANEELEELLGDEDNELAGNSDDTTREAKDNIDAIFKRTRLRIMVYTRLGEMEDEDEEAHLEDRSLWEHDGASDAPMEPSGLISWAATILLTSVLEYLAEQCVEVAGQAAYSRVALKHSGKATPTFGLRSTLDDQRLLIDEHDVERIALNSTLGRLWRTWRKTVRTPKTNGFQSMSTPYSLQLSARTSTSTLRPASGLDSPLEVQARSGLADDITSEKYSAHAKATRRSLDKHIYGSKVGKVNLSSEEEPNGSKKRTRASQLNIPPLVITTSPNGHPLPTRFPEVLHGVISTRETNGHEKQSHQTEPPSLESKSDVESALEPQERARMENDLAVVPVSGVLHLHFPHNNGRKSTHGYDSTREESVARFDFVDPASPVRDSVIRSARAQASETNVNRISDSTWNDENDLPKYKSDQSQHGSNTVRYGSREVTEGSWPRGVSNRYQPNSANTTAPLTVRIVQDGFQISNGPSGTASGGGNLHANVIHGNHRLLGLSTPNILKIVTAKEITPTSDGGYTPTPLSPRESGTSYESVTPVTGLSRPTSPSLSPNPAVANSPSSKDGLIAREPRIQTISTRDFADFIRSTAPTEEQARVAPILGSPTALSSDGTKSISSVTSFGHDSGILKYSSTINKRDSFSDIHSTPVHPTARNSSDLNEKRPLLAQSGGHSPTAVKAKNSLLEPRDPVNRGRSNDDLIAFLREGPPGADRPQPTPRENMERRIADKFNLATSPTSPIQTRDLTANSHSKQDSINSQSGLLSQSGTNVNRIEHPGYAPRGVPRSEITSGPRKQRRVKDPYAIPSDDEDEDVLTALPKKGLAEESLIDFLHSTGPSNKEDRSGRPSLEGRNTPTPAGSLRAGNLKLINLRMGPKASETTDTNAHPGLVASRTSTETMPHLGEFLSGRTSLQSSRISSDTKGGRYTDWDTAVSRVTHAGTDRHTRGHIVRDFWRKIAA